MYQGGFIVKIKSHAKRRDNLVVSTHQKRNRNKKHSCLKNKKTENYFKQARQSIQTASQFSLKIRKEIKGKIKIQAQITTHPLFECEGWQGDCRVSRPNY